MDAAIFILAIVAIVALIVFPDRDEGDENGRSF